VTPPVRRQQFKLAEFATWLAENGAEVGMPTNAYEVIRYRAFWQGSGKAVTHIVYTKESGLLTYMGGSRDHYEAFLHGDSLPDEVPTLDEKRVRRLKKTGAIREKLRKRDGDCCWFCGGLLASAESNVEHLINISDGGTNALSNLVLAHTACNTLAGNAPLAKKLELRAKLHARSNTPSSPVIGRME
jgi:hypothetical protein